MKNMKAMKNLNNDILSLNFSIEELNYISNTLKKNKDFSALAGRINQEIFKVKGENLNRKFNFNDFDVLPMAEKNILDHNGISNVQELIEANINTLKDLDGSSIGESTKEYLLWARKMYDLSSLANLDLKEKSKEKKSKFDK